MVPKGLPLFFPGNCLYLHAVSNRVQLGPVNTTLPVKQTSYVTLGYQPSAVQHKPGKGTTSSRITQATPALIPFWSTRKYFRTVFSYGAFVLRDEIVCLVFQLIG